MSSGLQSANGRFGGKSRAEDAFVRVLTNQTSGVRTPVRYGVAGKMAERKIIRPPIVDVLAFRESREGSGNSAYRRAIAFIHLEVLHDYRS
jgi:hypothetical protein